MKDDKKILTKKAEEIKKRVEEWIKQNLSLDSDGFITLVITITRKSPTVVIKQVSTKPKTPR